MRVCVNKNTGKLFEAQSNARPGTLLRNVEAAGLQVEFFEEREVDPSEFARLMDAAQAVLSASDLEAEAEKRLNDDGLLRLIFDMCLTYENRLRTLEGQPHVARAQYLQSLKTAYAVTRG